MASNEFVAAQRDYDDVVRPRKSHPNGWEPGIDTAAGSVTYVSEQTDAPADWSVIIRELGLDATSWTVDESMPVQVRTWDSGEKRMYYYRATVVPIGDVTPSYDIPELIKAAKRRKAPKPPVVDVDRALVVCLADWQAGKSDNGGPDALLDRLWSLHDAVPARARELKRLGRPVNSLFVVGLGDMVEGCDGHYPMQAFSVALTRREQATLVRRMLTNMLMLWSKDFQHVVVGCVPGNHGENRKDGKAYTSFEDNDDLAVFEQVSEVLAANTDAFDHVKWVIPDGDMTITLDIAGTVVSFAHGHQARGSGKADVKLKNWWESKMKSRHPVGDADVLVTGHYHHLQLVQDGPRTWMQCPANDGGSRWFEEQGGSTTRCGTLTFVVSESGWSDLEVLT